MKIFKYIIKFLKLCTYALLFLTFLSIVFIYSDIMYYESCFFKNSTFLHCDNAKKPNLNFPKEELNLKTQQNDALNLLDFRNTNYDALKLYVGKLKYIENISKAKESLALAQLKLKNATSENEVLEASQNLAKIKQDIKKAFNTYQSLCNKCYVDLNYKNFKENFVTPQNNPQSLLYSNYENLSFEDYVKRLNYVKSRLKSYVDSGMAQHCSDVVYNNVLPLENFSHDEVVYYFYEIKILSEELNLLHDWLDVIPEFAERYYNIIDNQS